MSKAGARHEELATRVKISHSREETAENNYQAAVTYAEENPAHGKMLVSRQNQDELLRISRKAKQASKIAETELEAYEIIEALSKKRTLAKQQEPSKEVEREKPIATQGFKRRGRDDDRGR